MTTPMFQQYATLKQGCPDAILFYRMGDFYECFFSDAKVVADELDLTLTARNKNDPDPVPMAGVPHHAAAGYIQRLVDGGHRVAIAEQVEDPAQAKGLVKRESVRVVTPGIVLDPTALESRNPNYIVSVSRSDAHAYGLAFIDLSTGDFRLTEVKTSAEIAEIHRFEPKAIVDPITDPGIRRWKSKITLSTCQQAWSVTAGYARMCVLGTLRWTGLACQRVTKVSRQVVRCCGTQKNSPRQDPQYPSVYYVPSR